MIPMNLKQILSEPDNIYLKFDDDMWCICIFDYPLDTQYILARGINLEDCVRDYSERKESHNFLYE